MKKGILKEVSRDVVALGSPIFFFLILLRVSITQNYFYLSQFILSGILFLLLMFLFKANIYSGLGFIALVFTSIYYNYLPYAIFGTFVYLSLLMSLNYLNVDKSGIMRGLVSGIVSSLVGYYLVEFIFS
ncbi:MAG: hypothetical protein WDZ77_02585 [Candidatus Pacearchaeota archaeon]